MTKPPEALESLNPNKAKAWANRVSIDDRLGKAVSEYVYRVSSENHGTKERNILAMLLPIGLSTARLISFS